MAAPYISPKLPSSTLQKLVLNLCPELADETQEIDSEGQRSHYRWRMECVGIFSRLGREQQGWDVQVTRKQWQKYLRVRWGLQEYLYIFLNDLGALTVVAIVECSNVNEGQRRSKSFFLSRRVGLVTKSTYYSLNCFMSWNLRTYHSQSIVPTNESPWKIQWSPLSSACLM